MPRSLGEAGKSTPLLPTFGAACGLSLCALTTNTFQIIIYELTVY